MSKHKFKVLSVRKDGDLETDIGIIDVVVDGVHKLSDFEVGKTYECALTPYLYLTQGKAEEKKDV